MREVTDGDTTEEREAAGGEAREAAQAARAEARHELHLLLTTSRYAYTQSV